MKKLFLILILSCFVATGAWALFAPMALVATDGAASCADCSGTASFIWECNSTTVGDTGFSPCGCSDGDTTLAATGGVSVSAGTFIMDDIAGGDGNDYYSADVSSDDVIDDTIGTVFIRLTVNTWSDDTRLFRLVGDANNFIYLSIDSLNDIRIWHEGNDVRTQIVTAGNSFATDTEYIIRARWRTADLDPNLQITFFNTSMVQQDDVSDNTNLTAFTTQAGAGDLKIGNPNNVGTGAKYTIKYMHFYKEWLDADPNV